MSTRPIHLIDEAEAVRKFREARIEAISRGQTPVPLSTGARIVLHVAALKRTSAIDLQELGKELWRLAPLLPGGFDSRPNFDGLLTYREDADGAHTYLQLFRDGSIETLRTVAPRPDGRRLIPSVNFEKHLIEAVPRCLSIQEQLGLEPPFMLMLSVLDASGYAFATEMRRGLDEGGGVIDADRLLVPEVMGESFDIDPPAVLKRSFDQLWNAAGWSGSLNYVDGRWSPPS